MKAAILVVSTTASKDPSADSTTEILRNLFESQPFQDWEVVSTKIVDDDLLDIQKSITTWTDTENSPNLIVSTGGTGFSYRDITPEVCMSFYSV